MRLRGAWTIAVVAIGAGAAGCHSAQVNQTSASATRSWLGSRARDGNPSSEAASLSLTRTAGMQQSPAAELNRQGMAYYADGKLDQAVAAYTQAVQMDRQYANAYYNRAAAYYQQNKYPQATADLDEAIRWDSQLAGAYLLRATIHMSRPDQPNYKAAIEDYRYAVQYNPTDVPTHNRLAYLLATCPAEGLRNPKYAEAYAGRACELTQWKDSESLLMLSAAHASAGDYKAAAKHARKAAECAPDAQKESCQKIVNHYVQQHVKAQSERSVSPYQAKALLAKIAQPFGDVPMMR